MLQIWQKDWKDRGKKAKAGKDYVINNEELSVVLNPKKRQINYLLTTGCYVAIEKLSRNIKKN